MLNTSFIKLLIAFLFPIMAFGQPSQWVFQNPLPDGESNQSISIHENNLYVCGLFGKIIKSTDAGKTWNKPDWQTIRNFFAIDFLNSNYGIVAGGSGDIFKTTNGGENWIRKYPPVNYLIQTMVYVNDTLIVAGGRNNIILRSADAGETWVSIPLPDNGLISKIHFINDTTGFACGTTASAGGVIYKTSDSGLNWEKIKEVSTVLSDVCSVNDTLLYTVGEHQILQSTDSGTTWTQLEIPPLPWYITLKTVKFADEKTGIAAGEYGLILRTVDGGKNWTQVTNNNINYLSFSWSNPSFTDVGFVDAATGYLIGTCGIIIKTTDAGLTWNELSSGNVFGLFDIDFINHEKGAAVGGNCSVVMTNNKGKQWTEKNTGAEGNLYSINMISDNHYVVTGSKQNETDYSEHSFLQVTNDGGDTWNYVTLKENLKLSSTDFFDENNGIVISYSQDNHTVPPGYEEYPGEVYKTTDGGSTWNIISEIKTDEAFYPTKLQVLSSTNVIAMGEYGVFYHSTDKGLTWGYLSKLPFFSTTTSLYFLNENTGFATSLNGIYRTDDGGKTWAFQFNAFDIGITVKSVHFSDLLNGYAVGESGTGPNYCLILKTVDGGNNWSFEYPPTVNSLYGVYTFGKDTAFAVGNGGTILSTYKADITAVEEGNITINDYILYQNYPNPFNPATTIRYTVPSTGNTSKNESHVSIKVFDILGNEIAELVNEEQSPGNYEVRFNAANYASGIYFYKLTAGTYNCTMKMIVLK